MHFDPYDPATQADPYPVYQELRDHRPVAHNEERGFWALSRFEDVLTAAHDPARFCSGQGITLEGQARGPFPNLITLDDPRHGELRKLVARGFTARPVSAFEGRVRDLAGSLIDDFAGDGSVELVAALTGPLPMIVVGDLIGVDPDDRERFRAWADALVHQDVRRPETVQAGREAGAAIGEYFAGIIAERRSRRRDDLVSQLLDATVGGPHLADEEVLGFCFLIIVAGTETTTNLIGNGTLALATHPNERSKLLADRSLVASAVEEMLRWDSPVQGLARTTTCDVELHGTVIPEGERVQLLFGAANRDEREFEAPDRFDVGREIERHVAFGHGVHYCLGAALARLEGRVVFEELLARIPDWHVDPTGVEWIHSSSVRGPARLPLEFTPSR
jgi:cytochrome P450